MIWATIFGTLAIVAVSIVIGRVIDKRLAPAPEALAAPPPAHAAGEAPAAAIRARPAQLARLRQSQRCPACRAALVAGADEAVHYDGRRLLVLHFTCPACAAKRALYVEPT